MPPQRSGRRRGPAVAGLVLCAVLVLLPLTPALLAVVAAAAALLFLPTALAPSTTPDRTLSTVTAVVLLVGSVLPLLVAVVRMPDPGLLVGLTAAGFCVLTAFALVLGRLVRQ